MNHDILQIMPAQNWFAFFKYNDGDEDLCPLISWALCDCWEGDEEDHFKDVIGLILSPDGNYPTLLDNFVAGCSKDTFKEYGYKYNA